MSSVPAPQRSGRLSFSVIVASRRLRALLAGPEDPAGLAGSSRVAEYEHLGLHRLSGIGAHLDVGRRSRSARRRQVGARCRETRAIRSNSRGMARRCSLQGRHAHRRITPDRPHPPRSMTAEAPISDRSGHRCVGDGVESMNGSTNCRVAAAAMAAPGREGFHEETEKPATRPVATT